MPPIPSVLACEIIYGLLPVPFPVSFTPLLPAMSVNVPVPSEPESSTLETISGSDFVPDPDMEMPVPAL